MAARFTVTLFDQNQKLITGKIVNIKPAAIPRVPGQNLTESSTKPGTYSLSHLDTGLKYTLYVEGTALPEWTNFAVGGPVGDDDVFLAQHGSVGTHEDITVTSITFV